MKYTWQHKKRIIFQHFVFVIQSKHLNKTFMLTNSQIYLMKIIQIPHIINPLMFNPFGPYTWVKVLMIIPEFMVLRLNFLRKSASRC